MSNYLERAEELIPAEVRMISGCRDEQTSADVSNVASFSLPDPAGSAGGACTSAMLKVLYANHKAPQKDLSFQEVLMKMRGILSQGRYTQIPELSSSRPLDIHQSFNIVPANFTGTRRAVMIGINYTGKIVNMSSHSLLFYVKCKSCAVPCLPFFTILFHFYNRPARTAQWMP
jgi:hypothetical protein